LRTLNAGRSPDLRVMLAAATRDARVWFPGIVKGGDHKLMMNFAVAHPESRGAITLASADPGAAPRILFNLLIEPGDIVRLRDAYKLMRDLVRQPAFAKVAGAVTRPDPEPRDDAGLDAYLRSVAATTSHPMGSCRMGIDNDAVVDAECRVRGIDGLRVVDASIFPTQISGNPHAAVMMLGDRVSDMIIGRPPLPPEPDYTE
jgi:choline dehydrogenase-like flavoprotein